MKQYADHYCEVCGVSSLEKKVCFRIKAGKYLCNKHSIQFKKFNGFKDTNSRCVYDSNKIKLLQNTAEVETYDSYGNVVETYIIDLEDVSKLKGYKWRTSYKNKKPYLVTKCKENKTIYFHRLIVITKLQVDHIDGNTLNNKKSNLRAVTIQENMYNLKKKSNNISGIRGISYDKKHKTYVCDFSFNKNRFHFKGFLKKEQAVYLRYLCETTFLKSFRNTSNDAIYKENISKLPNGEKIDIENYFNLKSNK